jgi:lipid II:glycine glycyltransferase (peptidoglycan interpeptide bridge formation enzyme)
VASLIRTGFSIATIYQMSQQIINLERERDRLRQSLKKVNDAILNFNVNDCNQAEFDKLNRRADTLSGTIDAFNAEVATQKKAQLNAVAAAIFSTILPTEAGTAFDLASGVLSYLGL